MGRTRVTAPVIPAAARGSAAGAREVLDRSGVALKDLLADGDLLVERPGNSRIELTSRLEAARGALVRNLPTDALALLDEIWEAAQHTEQGWYLRGSALAVLGLPGEATRVSQDALLLRPGSVALQYLLTIAQLAVGDGGAARLSLEQALRRAPDELVLIAQQAIVLARTGDASGSQRALQRAMSMNGEHPAVMHARAWIAAMTNPPQGMSARRNMGTPASSRAHTGEYPNAIDDEAPREEALHDDVLGRMFRGIAQRIASFETAEENIRQVRLMLRALSAGGSLSNSASPERVHAARALLAMISSVLSATDGSLQATNEAASAPDLFPLQKLVRSVVNFLRNGDGTATQLLERVDAHAANSLRGLLRNMVLVGANVMPQASGPPFVSAAKQQDAQSADIPSLIGPVRLGLSLLNDSQGTFTNASVRSLTHNPPTPLAAWAADGGSAELSTVDPLRGWAEHPPTAMPRDEQAGVRLVAVLCVLGAIAALSFGHPIVAIALGGGASWLGLRRSHALAHTAEHKVEHNTSVRRAPR